MRFPVVKVTIEIPYEDYKKIVELKGNKTWREVLYEWAELNGVKEEV